MAMLDCSLVYSKAQTDLDSYHTSRSPPVSVSPQRDNHSLGAREHAQSTTFQPVQPDQVSLSLSETVSTTPSSDTDRVFSSGDEESIEFRSDPVYDPVGTKTILSPHPGGLPHTHTDIERFFDDSATTTAIKPDHSFEELRRPSFSETSQVGAASLDEVDSLSTPRDEPLLDQDMDFVVTPVASRHTQSQQTDLPSSPPQSPSQIQTQNRTSRDINRPEPFLPPQPRRQSDHGDLWEEVDSSYEPHPENTSSPTLPRSASWRPSPLLEPFEPLLPQNRPNFDSSHEDKRLSIFDWSEHPRSERDSAFGSSPRPRTVHSKQANDARTGRGPSRRPPNTLHLRSQSVPVVKESHMDSEPGYPAKFGTWGLGHKGVSEEWTEDFEFDDNEGPDTHDWPDTAPTGMKVPQAIIDRQASVHGQFGQVQEFMLLVEGLKRLRQQGSTLGLLDGDSRQLWEDAESIINLATLNDEDDQFSPPQSPTFTTAFDDFDENSSPPPRPLPHFTSMLSELPTAAHPLSDPSTPGRPRGESLAQAKSFLQTMHQSRASTVEREADTRNSSSKLPFDTQDLRELVARTGAVTRSLKDIVRRAEGVFPSPQRSDKQPQDPPFSQIFQRPESSVLASDEAGLPRSTSLRSYFKDPINEVGESDPFLVARHADDPISEETEAVTSSEHGKIAIQDFSGDQAPLGQQDEILTETQVLPDELSPPNTAFKISDQPAPVQSPDSKAVDPPSILPESSTTHDGPSEHIIPHESPPNSRRLSDTPMTNDNEVT